MVGLGIGIRVSRDDPVDVRRAVFVDAAGHSDGSVSVDSSDGLVLTLSLKNLQVGTYRCLVQRTDGTVTDIASWPIDESGTGWWVVPLDVGPGSLRSVLIEDAGGARIASAALG